MADAQMELGAAAKKKKTAAPITAAEIVDILAARYPAPAFAFMPQLRDATGYYGSRTADACAFSLYPSRGLDLIGFEVKVDRRDWLRELKDPDKAETIAQFCDRWWIVAAEGVVKPEEVPPEWGWMTAAGKRLRVEKDAPKRTVAEQLDRALVASMFRNLHRAVEFMGKDYVRRAEISDEVRRSFDEGLASGIQQTEHKYEELKADLARFEAASGVKIERWTLGNIGPAVAAIRAMRDVENNDRWIERRMEHFVESMTKQADDMRAALAAFRASSEEARPLPPSGEDL